MKKQEMTQTQARAWYWQESTLYRKDLFIEVTNASMVCLNLSTFMLSCA